MEVSSNGWQRRRPVVVNGLIHNLAAMGACTCGWTRCGIQARSDHAPGEQGYNAPRARSDHGEMGEATRHMACFLLYRQGTGRDRARGRDEGAVNLVFVTIGGSEKTAEKAKTGSTIPSSALQSYHPPGSAGLTAACSANSSRKSVHGACYTQNRLP